MQTSCDPQLVAASCGTVALLLIAGGLAATASSADTPQALLRSVADIPLGGEYHAPGL